MAEEQRVWTGGCACGGVRYEIAGRPGPISFCHCGQCRRQHSHVGAYTTFPREALRLVKDETLTWYQSSETARRGFCSRCGSGVIWEGIGLPRIDVAAGTLDEPTGLHADKHIWVEFKADWYEIGEDGLPRIRSSEPGCASTLPPE